MDFLIEASFRDETITFDALELPIIGSSTTEAIAASFFKELPAFVTLPKDLSERAKSLRDLKNELEKLEGQKTKDERRLLELNDTKNNIDKAITEAEASFEELEQKKKGTLALIETHEETNENLEQEILKINTDLEKQNESLKNFELSCQTDAEKAGDIPETQKALRGSQNLFFQLANLLKTVISTSLATLGIFAGFIIGKLETVSFGKSVIGDKLYAYSYSTWAETFGGSSQAEEENTSSLKLVEQKNGLEKTIEKLQQDRKTHQTELDAIVQKIEEASTTFQEFVAKQDAIIADIKSKENEQDKIDKMVSSLLERVESAKTKLFELSQQQNLWLGHIKKGILNNDLRDIRTHFLELKDLMTDALTKSEDAAIRISISSKTKALGKEQDTTTQTNLPDPKEIIIQNAQRAKIQIENVDIESAEKVVQIYQQAIDDCTHALEFLDSLDPGKISNTRSFYEKCEELLAQSNKEIEKFEEVYRAIDKNFKNKKIKNWDRLLDKLIKSKKSEDSKNINDLCGLLKNCQEKIYDLVSELKVRHTPSQKIANDYSPNASNISDQESTIASIESESELEEDSSYREDLEGNLSAQIEQFVLIMEELQSIYSTSWTDYKPDAKTMTEANNLHNLFCKAVLSLLSANREVMMKLEEEDNLEMTDKVYNKWDDLSRKEKGVPPVRKSRR